MDEELYWEEKSRKEKERRKNMTATEELAEGLINLFAVALTMGFIFGSVWVFNFLSSLSPS